MRTLSLLLCAALMGVAVSQSGGRRFRPRPQQNFFQQRRPQNFFQQQRPQQNFRQQRPQQNFQPQQNFPQQPQQAPQGGNGGMYLSWREQPGRKFTWGQAKSQCEGLGKTLISLDSPQKNNQITGLLGSDGVKYIWTSGQRSGQGFVWANRSTVGGYGWSRTGGRGSPQPDNREGDEDCLAVLNKFYPGDGITWHDVSCHHKKPFICE